MQVPQNIQENFSYRLTKGIHLIQGYSFEYLEIGIFGSYARGDYKATSDIDICVVVKEKPSRHISGELREEAEILGCDIIFVTRAYLEHSDEIFGIQLRKDYRRIV